MPLNFMSILESNGIDFDISVTGAFLCSRVIGPHMVQNGGGVILNISSDLGIIAPDQRIYQKEGLLWFH